MPNEVLFMLDEAEALGGLPALQEALIRGRSGGVRLLLVYQSESQVRAAFRDQPSLIQDNCSTHVHIGAADLEDAEKTSKKLGEWTQAVESGGDNDSTGWQEGGMNSHDGRQQNRGSSRNWSVQARPLLKPDEVLRLSDDYIIAFFRGKSPLLARKIRWFSDPDFNPAVRRPFGLLWWALLLVAAGLIGWALWR